MIRATTIIWSSILIAWLCTACQSYMLGFRKPSGIRTLAIEVFGNETFRRGVEFDLTRSINQEVLNQTGFLIEEKEHADAVLHGRITDIWSDVGLTGPGNEIQEGILFIKAEAKIVNRRNGKILVQTILEDQADYLTNNQQNLTTATQKAVDRLARRLVLTLMAGLNTAEKLPVEAPFGP